MKRLILLGLSVCSLAAFAQQSGQPEALPPNKKPESPADVSPKPKEHKLFKRLQNKKKEKDNTPADGAPKKGEGQD